MLFRSSIAIVLIAAVVLITSLWRGPASADTMVSTTGASDRLLLGTPIAKPAGVMPNSSTEVTFRAQVDGTLTPPPHLLLDMLDHNGKPIRKGAARLRDTGNDGDAEANDLIYSGRYEINRGASELNFRVRTDHLGKEVVSGTVSFLVSGFPLKPIRNRPIILVPHPEMQSRVFANEVWIKVTSGRQPSAVRMIADSVGGRVAGTIPPLRIYLIEFPGNGSSQRVDEVIELLSLQSGVVRAMPNFKMYHAGISFYDQPECDIENTNCPNDGTGQWYLNKINARQAWEQAGGGDNSAKVAVIDGGVDCSHWDLNGRCIEIGNSRHNAHATQVAGVIAATANNGRGIAGIAWKTKLISIYAAVHVDNGGSVVDGYSFIDAMSTESSDAKIINVSQYKLLTMGYKGREGIINTMREAACLAVDAGKLVVIAGGNLASPSDENITYPAKLSEDVNHICTGPEKRKMVSQLLTVGGSNKDDGLSVWPAITGIPMQSCGAAYLDIYAPGNDIGTITSPSGVTKVNGTSYATAIVSGAAAVLWAKSEVKKRDCEISAKAIRDHLKTTADAATTICANCKRINLEEAVNTPLHTGLCAEEAPLSAPQNLNMNNQ